METELFRKEAVSKFLRGDVPGAALTITPPWSLAVFGTLAFVLVALGLLSVFGHAQVVAQGRGVVRPSKPPIVVHAPFGGTVTKVLAKANGDGRAHETILIMDDHAEVVAHESCSRQLEKENVELAALDNRLTRWNESGGATESTGPLLLLAQIRSQREKVGALTLRCEAAQRVIERSKVAFPVDARVADLAVTEGSEVREGDVLATLVPSSAQLVGYVALAETHRSEVEAGQAVQVKFDALPANEVGAGKARVTRVLDALPSGVKIETQEGSAMFVELSIDAMPRGSGPPRTGMTFGCDVLTRRPTILSMLFQGSGG
jgi:multidrug efflux pump subunit AcrA (membrane-fusion protein)